jgi:hypothetical protein
MTLAPSAAPRSGQMMRLVLDPMGEYHVSLDTVAEFEEAMRSDPRVRTVKSSRTIAKVSTRALRLWKKLHLGLPGAGATHPTRDCLVVLMSVDVRRCLPYFFLPGRKSVYLMDAWPNTHESIRELVRTFSVNHLFISSSMAAERLKSSLPRCTVTWVPEAIEPKNYRYLSNAGKDIDVLQMGRKYDTLHEAILPILDAKGKTYLYEKVKGNIVFPTRDAFVEGLARTKISICVPSNITHPDRSGDIETLSVRYLQSMASKCLVVGHAPAELVSLFGYNPVVEIDMANPAGHILSLLDDFDAHASLIERNFNTVVQHHTWHQRWAMMSRILFP